MIQKSQMWNAMLAPSPPALIHFKWYLDTILIVPYMLNYVSKIFQLTIAVKFLRENVTKDAPKRKENYKELRDFDRV